MTSAEQHFGPDGLRRFEHSSLAGARLPEASRLMLTGTGVPLGVLPYFRSAATTDPVALDTVAVQLGQPRPPVEMGGWPRIGGDGMAHLCVRPDGAVQAVVLRDVADDMFVNTDVSTFNASLQALDSALPALMASGDLAEAAGVFRRLDEELRRIDPAAFAQRESWWPRVLDDVRHTVNFPFSATFEYEDEKGERHTVTESAGPGLPHPEEAIWNRLAGQGVDARHVRRVYSQLEPCVMPGHYCSVWMALLFPRAEFTHSFDYGEAAESRERGLRELIVHSARRPERP
ncbi:SUKH-4 family immunity protein [Streptomyces sp. NPDC094032]|uniref:SUKH-4 family immunity protein n=1 Tax=Streptomyces sp. NPDC094032 TaxID=3155308 RepID=UPI003318E6FD